MMYFTCFRRSFEKPTEVNMAIISYTWKSYKIKLFFVLWAAVNTNVNIFFSVVPSRTYMCKYVYTYVWVEKNKDIWKTLFTE